MFSSEFKRMSREMMEHMNSIKNGKIPVDIIENNEGFLVKAYLPGFAKDEINVTLKDNLLTVNAEMKEEEKKEGVIYHKREVYRFKNMDRSLYLPKTCDAEQLTAKLSHGILNLNIPKKESDSPKTIEIS